MGSPEHTRRRSSAKKDEAVRKKAELELRRKNPAPPTTDRLRPGPRPSRPSSRRSQRLASAVRQGTVAALRPEPALTVPHTITVTEAAQLCAAKRTDCVLVVDDSSSLVGIFTAKDLAYRVVAEQISPHATPVTSIMTRAPLVTRDTMIATEALDTMVTRGFRHLPVCDARGDVVGLLDIAKVCYGALEKIERTYDISRQLHRALEGARSEWGPNAVGPQDPVEEYLASLQDRMTGPALDTLLNETTVPCTVSVNTSVLEAAQMMAEFHTTSVLVLDGSSDKPVSGSRLAGIFTSKDVVLRVIAPGIDPATCSVVRVMTPHPDTVPPIMSIHEAFRQMHNGHYLNLPVVDDERGVVGVVNVLHLTWAALELFSSRRGQPDQPDQPDQLPKESSSAWNPLWSSIDSSLSLLDHVDRHPMKTSPQSTRPDLERSVSDLIVDQTSSDLFPNDSASAVALTQQGPAPSSAGRKRRSVGGSLGSIMSGAYGSAVKLTGPGTESEARVGGSPTLSPQEDQCVFKFAAPNQVVHRLRSAYSRLDVVREKVEQKVAGDRFFRTSLDVGDDRLPDPHDLSLGYEDDDGDRVVITTDSDLVEAVRLARQQGRNRVTLLIYGGDSWSIHRQPAHSSLVDTAHKSHSHTVDRSRRSSAATSSLEDEEYSRATSVTSRPPSAGTEPHGHAGEKGRHDSPGPVPTGKPRRGSIIDPDMVLPAAIGLLGVAVLVALACRKPRGF